jgi:hypothetical protein
MLKKSKNKWLKLLDKNILEVYTMVMRKVFRYEFTCLRCGRTWESKLRHPLCCGKCKSPYWNRPRAVESVKGTNNSDNEQ